MAVKRRDRLRQDIEDGRFAGRHFQGALIHPAALAKEGFMELVHAFDQGLGQAVEQITRRGELDLGATALEEEGVEFPLQGLNLQGDGGLTQKDLVGGGADAARARGVTEGPQLLEPVLFVMELGGGGHGSGSLSGGDAMARR
jgi:hypothetical protein